MRPRWPSGKVSASELEGSRFEIRFHGRSVVYWACNTLNHTQWSNVLPLVGCGNLETGCQLSLDGIRSDSEDGATLSHQDESSSDVSVDEGPQPYSQSELNHLVRDLDLSKDGVELLWSRLKNKNLLTPGISLSWYRHREKEFTQFFSKEGNLVFCNAVQGLMKCFDIEYDQPEWRLFIDSSKTSLKAVLLHNGNSFASLPLGHSVHSAENYNDLSMILEKINYQEHRWLVCRDFKMLTMLLSQQAGYTKYPCFLCL
ncbi:hypothetical protein AVEN_252030-1 [Araneus ventricosus]|uniref:Uncharacterized protein n=1 Tax=Araneus ventricosus TaxID=182803 RepID=A0A4Y2UW99_ARAVE|nr:hypothetical protein AVEN_252030-1 [Araneus ventricosus]